jgi:predicted acylesterase/phospholipase RssA
MRICVCPVSGGSFCVQCAMLYDIYNNDYSHDVYMGSSGGAVSIFTLLSGCCNPNGIYKVMNCVDAKYIFKNWSYLPFVPSWMAGYSRGTFFNLSPYYTENMSKIVTGTMLKDKEFWIGAADIDMGKATIFCTRANRTTRIDPISSKFNTKYLDGNLNKILKSIISSATIPFLIPDTEIDGKAYVDGGLRASSPLTYLYKHISKDISIHLDYLSPSDVEVPIYSLQSRSGNLTDKFKWSLQEVVRTLSLKDRQCAIKLCKGYSNIPPDREGRCDECVLTHILNSRDSYFRTNLELYPIERHEVDLLSLTSSKVKCQMKKVSNNYSYRLWYC